MTQENLVPVSRRKQLLVEGRDDDRFFRSLLRHLAIDDIQVRSYQGKDRIGSFLSILADELTADPVDAIGIVMDADDSMPATFQSIQDNLRNVGLPVPTEPLHLTIDIPNVSAFIMPNNSGRGELEDLCLEAISDDSAMACVEDFILCVNNGVATPPRKLSKAKMHAFLASRERAYLRFGEFSESSEFPWNHPAFTDLAQFLKNL